MSSFIIPVGPASAIFCCNLGASSFQKLKAYRTNGIEVSDSLPREFTQESGPLQAGFHSISLNVTFLSDDATIYKIAKGISLSGNVNDPPGNQVYSLFVLNANPKLEKSYYFPAVATYKPLTTNYNKDKPTIMPITLVGTDRNPAVNLLDKGTFPYLLTTYSLSGKVPIWGY
jgi:hypothetical protein